MQENLLNSIIVDQAGLIGLTSLAAVCAIFIILFQRRKNQKKPIHPQKSNQINKFIIMTVLKCSLYGIIIACGMLAVQLSTYHYVLSVQGGISLSEFLDLITPFGEYLPIVFEQNEHFYFVAGINGVLGLFFGSLFGIILSVRRKKPSKGIYLTSLTLLIISLMNFYIVAFSYLGEYFDVNIVSQFLPNIFAQTFNVLSGFMGLGAVDIHHIQSMKVFYHNEAVLFAVFSAGIILLNRKAQQLLTMFSAYCIILSIFTLLHSLQANVILLASNVGVLCYFTGLFIFMTHPNVIEQFNTKKISSEKVKPKYVTNSAQVKFVTKSLLHK